MSISRLAALPRPDPAQGVFDTMLARDRLVQALDLHLERLAGAVRDLYGDSLPTDLGDRVRATASRLSGPHRLRVDAIPGADGLEVRIAATAAGPAPRAVALEPATVPGGIGPYKWRDRRLIEGLTTDSSVPLILDAGGELLEAAAANVWIREGHRILTPPADSRLLAGVTRALLLDLAGRLGLTAATEPLSLDRARASDTIFLTSSIRLVSSASLADGTGPGPDETALTRIRAVLGDVGWA